MKKNIKYIELITAVILFTLISISYFPDLFEGKKIEQHDIKQHLGMSKEAKDYTKKTGETILWTNSMFGGMPTYLIGVVNNYNLMRYLDKIVKFLPLPASHIFVAMLSFFILLLAFGNDTKISFIGALAYGFSTFLFIAVAAGHNSEVAALAFMPGFIAGIYMVLENNKYFCGSLIFAIFLSLELLANHLQITYYALIIIIIYGIIKLIDAIRKKYYTSFFKGVAILTLAAILAVGVNFAHLSATYEYGKESIRGKSELSFNKNNKTGGLDKDYATAWSYGTWESFNMFIPNLFGGASGSELPESSAVYKKLIDVGATKMQAKQAIKQMPTYWGPQPFTSGPVYLGALMIFLFILGLFLVKGSLRIWILIITVLSIMLAWGKYFMPLTNFFFDYIPAYNKFRNPSRILVIVEFAVPLLGVLALKNIFNETVSKEKIIKAVKYSAGILIGIALLFIINPGLLTFVSNSDTQLPSYLVDAIRADRATMMRNDAIRSIIFVLIGASVIWVFIKRKLKKEYVIIILAVAALTDLWSVNKRYLNSDNFVNKRKAEIPFTASQADKMILRDKSLDYRVVNLTVSTFNDASTSYFHKSIGGYNGAKMRRFQDIIDYELQNEIKSIISVLQKNPTQQSIDSILRTLPTINMLNTKYIIYNPNAAPIPNKYTLGNAWFVSDYRIVENADEEISSVRNLNPEQTVIVDKRFKNQLFKPLADNTANIFLLKYHPNHLTYKTNVKSDQIAVFSEIYYDKGWNVYIDGKPSKYFRADYVLRAMKIPAGEHIITFEFKPKSWSAGKLISLISSIILLIASLIMIFRIIKKTKTVSNQNN